MRAAGRLGESVPGAGAHGAALKGPRQQERAAPRLQPRPPPCRQARVRVHDRRGVPRRSLPRRRPGLPPRGPTRPRRRPLLGPLRRRPAAELVVGDLRGVDGGGEGGGGGADTGGGGRDGGRARGRGALRRKGVVRRRRRGVRGRRARRVGAGDTGVGADDRAEDRGPRQDAAAGGLGGAVLRARRGQDSHAGGRTPRRHGQEEARRITRGDDGGEQISEHGMA